MSEPADSPRRPPAPRTDRWLVAAAISVLLILVSASFRNVRHPDFWSDIKTGESIAAHGPPTVDVFSYTFNGREWIEPRWLSCFALAQVVERLGVGWALALQTLSIAGCFALATSIAVTRRTAIAACAVVSLAILASWPRFIPRPELATYAFLTIDMWLIDRFRKSGGRLPYLIPLIQIAWTNSHSAFVLGPIVAGIFFATTLGARGRARGGRARGEPARSAAVRTAALVFAATLIACLANPYGARVIGFTARLFTEIRGAAFRELVVQLRSPYAAEHETVELVSYKLLTAVGVASLLLNARRLDAFLTACWLATLCASIQSALSVMPFAIISVPFVLQNLGQSASVARLSAAAIGASLRRALAAALVFANAGFAWGFTTNRLYVRQSQQDESGARGARHQFPVSAVAALQAHGVAGPVFSTLPESSYLIHAGYEVFFDARFEIYTEAHVRRYIRLVSGGDDWAAAVRELGFRAALIDIGSVGLIRQLLARPDWDLVYFDECAAIFVRSDARGEWRPIRTPEDADAMLLRLRARFPSPPAYSGRPLWKKVVSPAPYRRVANFLIVAGFPDRAEPYLDDAIRADPGHANAP